MQILRTKKFERQLKKLARKHYPIQVLKSCIAAIVNNDQQLLKKIKDHSLEGNWLGYREFHPSRIGNYSSNYDGWVVVYKIQNDRLILTLVATGNHDILDR